MKRGFFNRVCIQKGSAGRQGGKASVLAGEFCCEGGCGQGLRDGASGTLCRGDIEVLRDELGKPYVNLYGRARKTAEEKGILRLEVSISNTREYAMAFAVGEGE